MTPSTVAKNHHRRAQVRVKEVNKLGKKRWKKAKEKSRAESPPVR